MKLKGQKIQGSNVELIIIPRGDGEPIVFKATAVMDMEEFEKFCPLPKPPQKMLPGGKIDVNEEAPSYKTALEQHAKKRTGYMILKSLEATEELEWEICDIHDPNTYDSFEKELKESGFSQVEVGRIIQGVLAANCLSESKIEGARKRFLASHLELLDQSSSLKDELKNTQSGEPVNDLEFVRRG